MRWLLLFAAMLSLAVGKTAADEGEKKKLEKLRAPIAARIKDITTIRGVRSNQLVGYGLVVGLNGSGDTMRGSPFTEQSIRSMLDRMGVNIRTGPAATDWQPKNGSPPKLDAKNVAGVIVTAELPAFVGLGSRIDVTVSSLGNAKSLFGGNLIQTPLSGPDGKIYAVAQGPVTSSGTAFTAGDAGGAGAGGGQAPVPVVRGGETATSGVPTTARIANGALVERAAPGNLAEETAITLELRNPDFNTAVSVVDVINEYAIGQYGFRVAKDQDQRTIHLRRPRNIATSRFIAEIGDLKVKPDSPATVVVDQRTGTIVIGKDVKISEVAVAHGTLTVRVSETFGVSQALVRSLRAKTTVTSEAEVNINQPGDNFTIMNGPNLEELVSGLSMIRVKPADIIAILQAIKSSGALQADLVVQ